MKRTRRPTHPGTILNTLYLDPLSISITDFADRIGISRKTISGIINGHRSVTPEMAVRFAMALPSTSAETWLNLQKAYDLYDAEQKLRAEHIRITPLPGLALA